MAIYLPIENFNVKKDLAGFKQNVSAEVAIVLGHSDLFKLQAWVKPNVFKREIKWLVQLLEAKKQDFSFFRTATFRDVENIMTDQNIKEVYFLGHGDSHSFKLYTGEILYYCDFNDPKYAKDYVHQIHCGTLHGKSLVDYTVPEQNRDKCFLFRRKINGSDVERELKKRIENAKLSADAHS